MATQKTSTNGSKAPSKRKTNAKAPSRKRAKPKNLPTAIVAIGGSAGGLKAYENFFTSVSPTTNMAFVLIPHLDPSRHSLMVDLVGKYTEMPVAPVSRAVKVQANHVYVIPPNKYLSLKNGTLRPEVPQTQRGIRMAIDYCFRSLAEDQGKRAVAIVLSGTGTDGTQGIKAIKEHGGLTMVQNPQSAQYDGMPRSAIATRMVDRVLEVEEMPAELASYTRHAYVAGKQPKPKDEPEAQDTPALTTILSLLKARTRHDFRNYKLGTVSRRIDRRMSIRQIETLEDYVKLLRTEEEEITSLFEDLLISVTSFYREREAYATLEEKVLPKLLKNRADDDPIRIWVPACATGEEAYSIAISMLEAMQASECTARLQIFATDIDERALEQARRGMYPETIVADVPMERLGRWFEKKDHCFVVNKQVRETVLFASQNIISDAPFSKLDLICCRNLLIYLENDAQQRLMALFNFALRADGYLFLGNSETLGRGEALFKTVSRKWRIYQRVQTTEIDRMKFGLGTPSLDRMQSFPSAENNAYDESSGRRIAETTQRMLLRDFVPASIVTNQKYEVLYMHGSTSDYLDFPTGLPSTDLLTLARQGLRTKLRSVVENILTQDRMYLTEEGRVMRGRRYFVVEIIARSFTPPGSKNACVVISMRDKDNAESNAPANAVGNSGTPAPDSDLIAQLEHELKSSQEELQGTIEELETSNEELKTSNEEAMSMNEELQSSNEEMETSKEELQSLNEELSTVNTELQEKIYEVEGTNNDLENLLSSTNVATLFLDEELRIKRFTPACIEVFNLINTDIGRPIGDISNKLEAKLDLTSEADEVLRKLVTIEVEESTEDGRWFTRRMMPYRTVDNRIEGVVLTFNEVTSLKNAEQSASLNEARYRALYHDNPSIFITLDTDYRILSINEYGATQLGASKKSMSGKDFPELHNQAEEVRRQLDDCCAHPGEARRWEAQFLNDNETGNWTRSNARLVDDAQGKAQILIVCEDIQEEHLLRERINYHATHDTMTGLINRREFESVLERAVATCADKSATHALCYIDLDSFKVVNDTHGHQAGDELLRQLATKMNAATRGRDMLGRLGGDEFAVLMEYCSTDEARRVAQEIVGAVRTHDFYWKDSRLRVGCSIGIVPIDASSGPAESIMQAADAACFTAKEHGSNSIYQYTPDDAALAHRRDEMAWVDQLRYVLENDLIEVHLQPIVDPAAENRLYGYEALARIRDKDNNLVVPGRFIAAAIRYGLVSEVDKAVLRKTLAFVSNHLDSLAQLHWISFNLAGPTLSHPEFIAAATDLIKSSGLPPAKIMFEITETSVISNLGQAQKFIAKLGALGCKFALDDFGTGLSSFHYLRNLDVDYLKIDGSFIIDLLSDVSDRAIVEAINDIAHLMGKKTIAEWVESDEILNEVRSIGIDLSQGYTHARPEAMEDIFPRGGLAKAASSAG